MGNMVSRNRGVLETWRGATQMGTVQKQGSSTGQWQMRSAGGGGAGRDPGFRARAPGRKGGEGRDRVEGTAPSPTTVQGSGGKTTATWLGCRRNSMARGDLVSKHARTGQGTFTDPVGKQGISLRTVWAPYLPGAGTVLEKSPRGLGQGHDSCPGCPGCLR